MLFWPAFIWRIFLKKKNSACCCLLKTKWWMKRSLFKVAKRSKYVTNMILQRLQVLRRFDFEIVMAWNLYASHYNKITAESHMYYVCTYNCVSKSQELMFYNIQSWIFKCLFCIYTLHCNVSCMRKIIEFISELKWPHNCDPWDIWRKGRICSFKQACMYSLKFIYFEKAKTIWRKISPK